VRAFGGMAQKRAHAVRNFGAEDVLELAGAFFHFVIVSDGKDVHEKTFGEPVPADDDACALFTDRREYLFTIPDGEQANSRHHTHEFAPLHFGVFGRVEMLNDFVARPDVFQNFIEILVFLSGEDEVGFDAAVFEVQPAVGEAADAFVMSDHDDATAFGMKVAQEAEDDALVFRVEVAGGLVSEDYFRVVDERAGDGHTLLFSAGKLRRQMCGAISHPDVAKCFHGLVFIGHAVEVLSEHHVFQRREMGDQMEVLEDKADGFAAETGEIRTAELGGIGAVDADGAGGGLVETAEEVQESGFAGAGGAHDGDPFALIGGEGDAVEGGYGAGPIAVEFTDVRQFDESAQSYSPLLIYSPLRIIAGWMVQMRETAMPVEMAATASMTSATPAKTNQSV
jgi:hypothetical protein